MTILKKVNPEADRKAAAEVAAAATYLDPKDTEKKKKFEPSERIFLEGVSYTPVPLGSVEYSLRHPRTPEVVEDWKNLIFTQEEADFLNDLNLRPHILADIYSSTPDVDWKSELAKNMATIVRSKCFKDPRLVLHSDCQVSNTFIQKVLDYYVENDARITSLEFDEEQAELISSRIIQKITNHFASHLKDENTSVDESIDFIEKVFQIGQQLPVKTTSIIEEKYKITLS
jgi:hypothetical protein